MQGCPVLVGPRLELSKESSKFFTATFDPPNGVPPFECKVTLKTSDQLEYFEDGYKLKVGGAGIVGYVSRRGQPRIALDVGADAVHFKNPYLPDTRSELALPFKVGGRVIGALDVQSQQSAAFV